MWVNIIIQHSSELIESNNEIRLLDWKLVADFCSSIELTMHENPDYMITGQCV